ncbi:MAG: sensor domain-containing diguanylate cyclase [Gemmatimonadetes bacterium]|nr:sensor domain-containing diguanylate cyclase [Gemmatimonadota bacterium]
MSREWFPVATGVRMSSTGKATAPASLSERYQVLLEIGKALTGVRNDDELYALIYRETARVMEADGFYISVYDDGSDEATVVFWADGGKGRRSQVVYAGSESQVIRQGAPVMVSDGLMDQSLLVLGEEGDPVARSAISAPLMVRGQVFGVISTQSYRPGAYAQADLELLEGIAGLAAVAIQNVSHVQELDRRCREAENMEEIVRALVSSVDIEELLGTVADAALDLLGADGAVAWLFEEDLARVGASRGPIALDAGTTFPLEGGLVTALLEERRAVIVEDVRTTELLTSQQRALLRSRCALVVPLVHGERVTGALSVEMARPRPFRKEDQQLLERLAGHAMVALQNAQLHASLQAASLTDPLTKLPNRRHLEMHLTRELAAAQRGRKLSVVLFDLDNFKQHNDTLGHLAGDGVLEAMGEVLAIETRAMNLVARYGGDEFVAVLSDTPAEGARLHAGRVADRVARHPGLAPYGITLSAGVAEYGESARTIKDLLKVADEDLYRSKAEKRSG